MQSRAARLILLCLFLVAIVTAAFLFRKANSEAATAFVKTQAFAASARTIERGIYDLRTAQLGYAAAGQPGDRWIGRVAHSLDRVRVDLKSLRGEATAPEAQAGLDATAVALGAFERSDKRAVDYVRTEQRLLASDVVFGDGLERLDAALTALEGARVAEVQSRDAAVGLLKSRQMFALTAGAAASVLVVLLLVPVPRTSTKASAAPEIVRLPEPAAVAAAPREIDFSISMQESSIGRARPSLQSPSARRPSLPTRTPLRQ